MSTAEDDWDPSTSCFVTTETRQLRELHQIWPCKRASFTCQQTVARRETDELVGRMVPRPWRSSRVRRAWLAPPGREASNPGCLRSRAEPGCAVLFLQQCRSISKAMRSQCLSYTGISQRANVSPRFSALTTLDRSTINSRLTPTTPMYDSESCVPLEGPSLVGYSY